MEKKKHTPPPTRMACRERIEVIVKVERLFEIRHVFPCDAHETEAQNRRFNLTSISILVSGVRDSRDAEDEIRAATTRARLGFPMKK